MDLKSSKTARCKRVRSLRQMTRLSRREFAQRYGISASTLQNWEDENANGLTEKGARRLVNVLKSEGIHCPLEWLLHGVGTGPTITDRLYLDSTNAPTVSHLIIKEDKEKYFVTEELKLFRQHNKHTIDIVITDDAMEPRFVKGEYVAGYIYPLVQIFKLIGIDCIIATTEGELLVRNLRKGTIEGRYHLFCSNLNSSVEHPILYNVEVASIAPVLWARRHFMLALAPSRENYANLEILGYKKSRI